MIDDNATIKRLEQQLAAAERRLAQQAARLTVVEDLRSELAAVRADRDRLERQVASLGSMQSETLALGDDEEDDTIDDPPLASLDELMDDLDAVARLTAPEDESVVAEIEASSVELIAPELVFPERDDADNGEAARQPPEVTANSRLLVRTDVQPPIKYPLYKERLTIGRASAADVTIDDEHVSRVHARISVSAERVVVEDLASRNGIRINGESAERGELRHGDVFAIGRYTFRYIDRSGRH